MTDDQLSRAEATAAAAEIWAVCSDSEQACIRFGMLPRIRIEPTNDPSKYKHIPSRLLAVALFDCAKRDGGMVA